MIYLDSAATTPIKPEVLDVIVDVMKNQWGNPSAVYENGLEPRRMIENARKTIAKSINAEPEEIIFTSGASEANALAIDGFLKANSDTYFVTSNIEHSSIPMFKADNLVTVSSAGVVRPSDLVVRLFNVPNQNKLVSIFAANNEIGTVNDIKKLSEAAHRNGAIFHTDATQYYPYYKIDVKDMGIDMMSVSGHKFGCPKGIGFLYVKKGVKLSPIIYGTQEDGMRGGTYNTPYIVGLAKAVELIDYTVAEDMEFLRDDCLFAMLNAIDKEIKVNGLLISRLPNNLNIRINGVDAQSLVSMLDMYNVCISAGSACHAGDPTPSHVLKALGLTDEQARASIRITFNAETTKSDIEEFVKILKMVLAQLG